MLLKVFNKYITELMYAEVYFTSAGRVPACRFNRFRSRRKYIYSCLEYSRSICNELEQAGLCPYYHRYITLKLQEAGKMFVVENGEVVSHRNILVYLEGDPVPVAGLDIRYRRLLSAFLSLQYSAWVELCHLCESFFSVYRGAYLWQGNEIELLELGDALWGCGYIRPLSAEKTKKIYFRHLFGFFNLPVREDPCHRLGELALRSHPDSFLVRLRDKYRVYWESRES